MSDRGGADAGWHAQAQLERVFLPTGCIQANMVKQVWPCHPKHRLAGKTRTSASWGRPTASRFHGQGQIFRGHAFNAQTTMQTEPSRWDCGAPHPLSGFGGKSRREKSSSWFEQAHEEGRAGRLGLVSLSGAYAYLRGRSSGWALRKPCGGAWGTKVSAGTSAS
jgi:hypothetical protein